MQAHSNDNSASSITSFKNSIWKLGTCGNFAKEGVQYLSQITIIFIVICTALYNLTYQGQGQSHNSLWASILSGCIGYMLPQPKLNRQKNVKFDKSPNGFNFEKEVT